MNKSQYNDKLWKELSKSVIELDNNKCTYCGKKGEEVVLQVHHKKYNKGCMPWEYALNDLETVCKGCHASIHGKIMPRFGWEYCWSNDMEDLTEICDYCGSNIRYTFVIFHEKWGIAKVGTVCCDNLTDTDIASNLKDSKTKYFLRKERFIKSSRWKFGNGIFTIKQGLFVINVIENRDFYFLKIHNLLSDKHYPTLDEAKSKAFDVIENGELIEYLKRKKIEIK